MLGARGYLFGTDLSILSKRSKGHTVTCTSLKTDPTHSHAKRMVGLDEDGGFVLEGRTFGRCLLKIADPDPLGLGGLVGLQLMLQEVTSSGALHPQSCLGNEGTTRALW